jgi:hypothetical protein
VVVARRSVVGETQTRDLSVIVAQTRRINSAGRRRDLGDFLTLCGRTRWLIVKPHISHPYEASGRLVYWSEGAR